MTTKGLPPDNRLGSLTIAQDVALNAEDIAQLLLSLGSTIIFRGKKYPKFTQWLLSPELDDWVILYSAGVMTPTIERVGILVGHWSYVPKREETWMVALVNGHHVT